MKKLIHTEAPITQANSIATLKKINELVKAFNEFETKLNELEDQIETKDE